MNLHAILCWWDESPTWLAATIASLSTIGVDHVIAVDGRYPHFEPEKPETSRSEQLEAVHTATNAIGARLTLHQPLGVLTEVEKRTRAFQLLNLTARTFEDWVCVIDADELVVNGSHDVQTELAALHDDIHVARVRITDVEDPHAKPAPDNNIRKVSEKLYQKFPDAQPAFTAQQSRMFRVLADMRTERNHWAYTGIDQRGRRVFLRNDTGQAPDGFGADVVGDQHEMVEPVEWLHRKNHRIAYRQARKVEYYQLRNSIGLEA